VATLQQNWPSSSWSCCSVHFYICDTDSYTLRSGWEFHRKHISGYICVDYPWTSSIHSKKCHPACHLWKSHTGCHSNEHTAFMFTSQKLTISARNLWHNSVTQQTRQQLLPVMRCQPTKQGFHDPHYVTAISFQAHKSVQFSANMKRLRTTSSSLIYILSDLQHIYHNTKFWKCRPQWPRVLRHVRSLADWTLGSWFRIPLEAWMCVRVFLCSVVLCR
jgi:hypothetical protein